MSIHPKAVPSAEAPKEAPQPPIWLRASIEDAKVVDFDAVIATNRTSEANDLGDDFHKASVSGAKDGAATDDASPRELVICGRQPWQKLEARVDSGDAMTDPLYFFGLQKHPGGVTSQLLAFAQHSRPSKPTQQQTFD